MGVTKNDERQDKSPIARFYDSLAPLYTRLREFGHERDGQNKDRLINALSPFDNDVILDVGTGPGIYAIDIARKTPDSRIIGIDISEAFVTIAHEKAQVAKVSNTKFSLGNIEDLDFEDAYFTKIICAGVISVVKKRDQAVAELARVLKPGGHLAVREPMRSNSYFSRLTQSFSGKSPLRKAASRLGLMFGHFSPDFMTEPEIKALFDQAGFSDLKVESIGPDLLVVATK